MKKLLIIVLALFATSFLHAQSFDLPCASGTAPLLAPTYNPSTGNYRAWVCVDPFGTVSSPVFATAGAGTAWGTITGTLSNQTDLNTALAAKAPLVSPALTGTPTAPTPTVGDNTTTLATTAYVVVSFAPIANPVFTGAIGAAGATSGTATLTPPAIAGTRTNPWVSTNTIQTNSPGSVTSPAFAISSGVSGSGVYQGADSTWDTEVSGTEVIKVDTFGDTILGSGGTFQWANAALGGGTATTDTQLSRLSAGIVAVGTTSGTSGSMAGASFQSRGTKFTASGCSNTTTLGGASAGSFHSGTTGTCTVTVTMGNTATSVNGWSCSIHDQTTVTDIINLTASNATTATFSGTTATGDVISFDCIGY